jgi:hypothetical protein
MARRPLTALAAGVASHETVSMRVRRGRERRRGHRRGCWRWLSGIGRTHFPRFLAESPAALHTHQREKLEQQPRAGSRQ